MNFLKAPNLPQNNVKAVIIDKRAKKLIQELNNLGIYVIETNFLETIEIPIATHPDMQICHIGNNNFYVMGEVWSYYKKEFELMQILCNCEKINNFLIHEVTIEGKLLYPNDCKLNSAISNEWIITHINNNLFDNINKNVIKTKQGYAKCSIGVVSDNAIITADKSIEKLALLNGIDVCLVTNDSIRLDGYKNGFIGGCCGKISKDTLAFSGDLKFHPECDKIKNFCKNYKVECLSLTNEPLTDYGSIIPILE